MMKWKLQGRSVGVILRQSAKGWKKHFINICTPRFVIWIRKYTPRLFLGDILSALVITSICIPQAMAYAVTRLVQASFVVSANVIGGAALLFAGYCWPATCLRIIVSVFQSLRKQYNVLLYGISATVSANLVGPVFYTLFGTGARYRLDEQIADVVALQVCIRLSAHWR
jgi:hypothetical protein